MIKELTMSTLKHSLKRHHIFSLLNCQGIRHQITIKGIQNMESWRAACIPGAYNRISFLIYRHMVL